MANTPLPEKSMNNTVPSSQPAINCPECSHIEHILYYVSNVCKIKCSFKSITQNARPVAR